MYWNAPDLETSGWKTHFRRWTKIRFDNTVSQSVLPLQFSSAVFADIESFEGFLILNHLKMNQIEHEK